MIRVLAGLALLVLACAACSSPLDGDDRAQSESTKRFAVQASTETDPVAVGGDAADDIAVWIHPDDPSSSLIIGTIKHDVAGGLDLYNLDGRLLPGGFRGKMMNNVDVRYGFLLNGEAVDIVAASNRTDDSISVFRFTPSLELLSIDLDPGGIAVDFGDDASNGVGVYGFCLYQSRVSGKLYGFVSSKTGFVAQIELKESERAPGKITGSVARVFDVNPGRGTGRDNAYLVEGCVADDYHQVVYLAEEDAAIWMYPAEPGVDGDPRLIDGPEPQGHLAQGGDVEGLAIYQLSESSGYLIASVQGDDAFNIYEREEPHTFLAQFEITDGAFADGTNDTDGIEVVNLALGHKFGSGLFVAQDGINALPGNSGYGNFKLVHWGRIAHGPDPNLKMATEFNPRYANGVDPSSRVAVRASRPSGSTR